MSGRVIARKNMPLTMSKLSRVAGIEAVSADGSVKAPKLVKAESGPKRLTIRVKPFFDF
jgi:hypothetical protein